MGERPVDLGDLTRPVGRTVPASMTPHGRSIQDQVHSTVGVVDTVLGFVGDICLSTRYAGPRTLYQFLVLKTGMMLSYAAVCEEYWRSSAAFFFQASLRFRTHTCKCRLPKVALPLAPHRRHLSIFRFLVVVVFFCALRPLFSSKF